MVSKKRSKKYKPIKKRVKGKMRTYYVLKAKYKPKPKRKRKTRRRRKKR